VIGDLALVVHVDGCLGQTQLLLDNVGLDAHVGELVAQALCLYAQLLALALSNFDFFFEHNLVLDGDVVL
jgi:hypothetical protein